MVCEALTIMRAEIRYQVLFCACLVIKVMDV
jgi:hypothetical protein